MCSRNSDESRRFCELHQAVVDNSLEALDQALREHVHLINCVLVDWGTPLLMSIRAKRNDRFIVRLIEAGSDVNATHGGSSALFYAIDSSVAIAEELIKRGADINALNQCNGTVLHRAVWLRNMEAVSMLLYYGADPCVQLDNTLTAFNVAQLQSAHGIVRALFNYYDFSLDIPYVFCDYDTYSFLLKANNAGLFKLGWRNWIYTHSGSFLKTLLTIYLRICEYPRPEWVQCLSMILACRVALQSNHCFDSYILENLLDSFCSRRVEAHDRRSLIYLLLGAGFHPHLCSCKLVYERFGFDEEFEALIYASHYTSRFIDTRCTFAEMVYFTFTLALDKDIIRTMGTWLLRNVCLTPGTDLRHYLKLFKYFALPFKLGTDMRCRAVEQPNSILLPEVNQVVAIFPSLLELSRNEAREFIKRAYKVKNPYQFHDAVRRLNLPTRLKDVLLFKEPIY